MGRKNWLFSATVDGANASMGIYTIVEMADEELEKLAPLNKDIQKACAKCENDSK